LNDLLTLLHELEKEQTNLKRLIDQSIRDGEYLMAHYHSEAIGLVNRKLQTLRNLDDKNYDSKKMISQLIRQSELQLEQEYPDRMKDHFKKEIEKLKLELEELEKREKVSVRKSVILSENLNLVLSRKQRGIRIVLKKSANFSLEVRRNRLGVKILIRNIKSLRKNYLITDENIQHFYALGFKLSKGENTLTLIRNRSKENLLAEIKTIISKIVFEIFYFKEFEGDTCIEIIK
jgi:hypothetical protein